MLRANLDADTTVYLRPIAARPTTGRLADYFNYIQVTVYNRKHAF
jgi:hypothetical protein